MKIKCFYSIAFCLALWFLDNPAQACTRVFYNADPRFLISGRNLDYFGPVDPTLKITPRNITHGNTTFHWKARYGSVVIYADDQFPMEGMNEKGLLAHTLYFTEGKQAQENQQKPILTSNYWVSYLLDNSANVREAIQSLQNVSLKAILLPIDYDTDTKHIALEDTTGDSAIIEIVNGQVLIHHNKAYTVMTNLPNYAEQLKILNNYLSKNIMPNGWDSSDRFVRASMSLQRMPKPHTTTQALGNILAILSNVAKQPNFPHENSALSRMYQSYSKYPLNNRGYATYWQTLWDLNHKILYFKSIDSPFLVFVSFKEINFAQGQPILNFKHLDQYPLTNLQGNIKNQLVKEGYESQRTSS